MERSMSEQDADSHLGRMGRMDRIDEMELEPCFSRLQSVEAKMNVGWSPFVGKTPDKSSHVEQFQIRNRHSNLGMGMASLVMSPASEADDEPSAKARSRSKSKSTSISELESPLGGGAAGIGERRGRRQLTFGEMQERSELQLDPFITSLASSATSSTRDNFPADAYYSTQHKEQDVEEPKSIRFVGVKEYLLPRPKSACDDDEVVESPYTCYFCCGFFSSHQLLEQHVHTECTCARIQQRCSPRSSPANQTPHPCVSYNGNGTISIKVALPIQKDKYKAGIQRLCQYSESESRPSAANSSNIVVNQDEQASCPMCSMTFCSVREFKVHSVQVHGQALWK